MKVCKPKYLNLFDELFKFLTVIQLIQDFLLFSKYRDTQGKKLLSMQIANTYKRVTVIWLTIVFYV